MDILNEIPKKRYDVIISNPPYIPMNNISSLDLSVRVYDPLDALTDYGDGMKFYKRFFEISNSILNKNGIIIFEFGDVIQKNRIIDIFHNFKYEIYNDATNQPRVIVLQ
tara:strand:+ start:283 stop:609 length:327 start_codon:yes stop_codon:yes gene_type:complete